jgi:hypothetical protein
LLKEQSNVSPSLFLSAPTVFVSVFVSISVPPNCLRVWLFFSVSPSRLSDAYRLFYFWSLNLTASVHSVSIATIIFRAIGKVIFDSSNCVHAYLERKQRVRERERERKRERERATEGERGRGERERVRERQKERERKRGKRRERQRQRRSTSKRCSVFAKRAHST